MIFNWITPFTSAHIAHHRNLATAKYTHTHTHMHFVYTNTHSVYYRCTYAVYILRESLRDILHNFVTYKINQINLVIYRVPNLTPTLKVPQLPDFHIPLNSHKHPFLITLTKSICEETADLTRIHTTHHIIVFTNTNLCC